jgi:murein DD-endopeptidase MepM/ murein hydrolase activator NlpD
MRHIFSTEISTKPTRLSLFKKLHSNKSIKAQTKTLLNFLTFIHFSFTFLFFSLSAEPYHWPVKGEKIVTGSFAEFRKYYFHHGLDMGTEGKIGLPILAMNSGRVTKLQSLRYSIGNAVILTQIDGFNSRYGHMEKFSEKIISMLPEDIQKKIQLREDFQFEIDPNYSIPIEKGEIIGYSGESGIGPPHLHVELYKEDVYYNPANFLDLKGLEGEFGLIEILLEVLNNDSYINGSPLPLSLKFQKKDGVYIPIDPNPIKIKGKVGVFASAFEATGRGNRIGFQEILVRLNSKEIQKLDFSRIPKHQMIRSCFVFDNYKSKMSGKPFKYTVFSREEKSLEVFQNPEKFTGALNSKDLNTDTENIFEIDFLGLNSKRTTLRFKISPDFSEIPPVMTVEKNYNVYPNTFNYLTSTDKVVETFFPAHSVFTKEAFLIIQKDFKPPSNPLIVPFGKIYGVRPDFREFDEGFELFYKMPPPPNELPQKFGLYNVTDKGEIIGYISNAEWNSKNHTFKIKSRASGFYGVFSDFSPPTVQIHRHKSGQSFKQNQFKLFLKVKDAGSGVPLEGLNVTIDGLDHKLDYDPESRLWEVFHPIHFKEIGKHTLEAIAKDYMGNESEKILFEYIITP